MKTIQLNSEVMVSDPCYSVPTWCQHKLTNVLPGEYVTNVFKSDEGAWGTRVGILVAVHKDYVEDDLSWRAVSGASIGVDSGQCGIFSMETYRKDEIFMNEVSEFNKDYLSSIDGGGDQWYGHMCDRTLCEDQWGTYSHGAVSSSGYGDGSYRLCVAKHKGKIVGIGIDYLGYKNGVFNLVAQNELV